MITDATLLEPIALTHGERKTIIQALETWRMEREKTQRELAANALSRDAPAAWEYVASCFEESEAVKEESKALYQKLTGLSAASTRQPTNTSNNEQEVYKGKYVNIIRPQVGAQPEREDHPVSEPEPAGPDAAGSKRPGHNARHTTDPVSGWDGYGNGD